MIYCHDLADVWVSPSDVRLLQLADEAAGDGYTLPGWTARKHELLMADIERVARWKFGTSDA